MRTHRATKVALALILGAASVTAIAPVLSQGPPEPTAQHEMLMKGVGKYKGTLTMWMPGMPDPMKAECTENVTAIGGMWTTSRFETAFMGQPFVGSSNSGYDPAKGKFIGTWIDSMNPMLTVMEGTWDEEKNALVMEYEMMDGMTGEMVDMRSVATFSEGGYDMMFFQVTDEGEQRQMRIEMTRADG